MRSKAVVVAAFAVVDDSNAADEGLEEVANGEPTGEVEKEDHVDVEEEEEEWFPCLDKWLRTQSILQLQASGLSLTSSTCKLTTKDPTLESIMVNAFDRTLSVTSCFKSPNASGFKYCNRQYDISSIFS